MRRKHCARKSPLSSAGTWHFELNDPRAFIPVIGWLAYDHLWHGAGTNNPVCWDVIAEKDLEETGRLVIEILDRLTALAARVNALAVG